MKFLNRWSYSEELSHFLSKETHGLDRGDSKNVWRYVYKSALLTALSDDMGKCSKLHDVPRQETESYRTQTIECWNR